MRDLNKTDLADPDSGDGGWSGQGWGLMTPLAESDSWSGQGWGLLTAAGATALDPAVADAVPDSGQPTEQNMPFAGGGVETSQGGDDGGILNGKTPGGLFAEEDDGPDSRPDEGYLAQDDDAVDDASGLETGSFDTAALQPNATLPAARDSDDGATAHGTDPAISAGPGTVDGAPESYQAVKDGFQGPPPPHEFEQSGCACAGCSDTQPGGNTSTGAQNPATSIQDLARYLSEYNSTISGSNGGDDFWDEFWGIGTDFHWNLTDSGTNAKNGTLTYNISGSWWDDNGITDDGADAQTKIDAIRHALNVYEDILGINFVETTDTAEEDVDIAFGNEESGAFANFNFDWNGGELSNAWINIDENWSGDGTIGDYYFSTVLHEVGHALGLGHSGNYNAGGGATHDDAYWENDTEQYTMMSYWSQSNYTAQGEHTPTNVVNIGPQSVDWFALNRMYDDMGYGIDDGATTGDTTWGFNSSWYDWTPTSSGPAEGYANTAFASLDTLLEGNTMTIVDGGGTDTLDLSGFDNNTKIDISIVSASDTTPAFSDVAGLTGNLMIGVDTVIENVIGGAGSEEIIGNTGDNTLDGGDGDDTILGGDGNDILLGGNGDDYLDPGDNAGGSTGYDIVSGGLGNDTIDFGQIVTGWVGLVHDAYGAAGQSITVDIDGVANTGTITGSGGDVNTLLDVVNPLNSGWTTGGLAVRGTDNADTFTVKTDDQQWMDVAGKGGNDSITVTGNGLVRVSYHFSGGAVVADLGAGTVQQDGFTDTITGDVWEIRAGDGNDSLLGSGNDESFITRGGNDTVDGGGGFDRVRYDRSGNDGAVNVSLSAGTAQGSWNGTAFTDQLSNIEWVRGGGFNDTIEGDSGANRIEGRGGDDTLTGGAGNDTLEGGTGNDLLNGGTGSDSLDGGTGNDELIGWAGNDVVFGADGQDTLIGHGGNDTLLGQSDDDVLAGWAGNDQINGGTGSDTIYGGTGNDRLVGWSGNDLIFGAEGQDTLIGHGGNDTLLGQSDDDVLAGWAGNDQINGGTGSDTIYGGTGNDGLVGWAGNDKVYGGEAQDTIFGHGGNDTLLGQNGDDVLAGWAGDDQIRGGAGNDLLAGGTQSDDFIFVDGFGQDTIVDFDANDGAEDIDLQRVSSITDFADLMNNHVTEAGSHVLIEALDGSGDFIRVNGVTLADLDQTDFIL
jgi:Ca2+-binding RTX toxin-like protein